MSSKNIDVIDLFNEELDKKEKKLDKRVFKSKQKELKKLDKKKKMLELKEEMEFDSYLKKIKKTRGLDNELEIKNNKEIKRNYPILNFIITSLSVILLVVSFDYLFYNIFSNFKDMINSILLVSMVIFYLLSILFQNIRIKKICQIISLLLVISFMSYHLFLA